MNGYLVQERDNGMRHPTRARPRPAAPKVPTTVRVELVKHTKSNTVVFAKNGQLLASGTGQTSRVDALKQA